jgi:hypothetical protein
MRGNRQLVMIVDHDADLRIRAFAQVRGVLTATGG